jgi:hypothetical protein
VSPLHLYLTADGSSKHEMAEVISIGTVIVIILLLIALILILIYLLPIIFIPSFHSKHNILIGNVSLISMIGTVYWIVYTFLFGFYMNDVLQSAFWCIFSSYPAQMFNCLFIYSITMITINRFVTIIYPNKDFFKRHAWSFMSAAIQWVISAISPMPHLILATQVSTSHKD